MARSAIWSCPSLDGLRSNSAIHSSIRAPAPGPRKTTPPLRSQNELGTPARMWLLIRVCGTCGAAPRRASRGQRERTPPPRAGVCLDEADRAVLGRHVVKGREELVSVSDEFRVVVEVYHRRRRCCRCDGGQLEAPERARQFDAREALVRRGEPADGRVGAGVGPQPPRLVAAAHDEGDRVPGGAEGFELPVELVHDYLFPLGHIVHRGDGEPRRRQQEARPGSLSRPSVPPRPRQGLRGSNL
mmetsp:Transcript_23258/g.69659  ORF Transcript_23258/g.69659 Transcript_23258/m.69659 type:complete len:243 (+) Transcript_23258:14-742(+)